MQATCGVRARSVIATTLFAAALLFCLCYDVADGASCAKPPKAKRLHEGAAVDRAPFGTFSTSGNWSYLVPRHPEDVRVTFVIYRNGLKLTDYRLGMRTRRYLNEILDGSVTILCHDLPKKYGSQADRLLMELVSYKKKNATVILIDWNVGDCAEDTSPGDFYYCPSALTDSNIDLYQQAAGDSRLVARQTARFLLGLANMRDWEHYSLDNVHFIGFGIGAHVGAFLADELSASDLYLGRLTALDPARFLFEDSGLSQLSQDSAAFVDVVHTSCLGILKPVGHIDFYVNVGEMQPGCTDVRCSHVKALSYYSRSVRHCETVTVRAHNNVGDTGIFGYRSYLSNVTGVYDIRVKSDYRHCDYSTEDTSFDTSNRGAKDFISAVVILAAPLHFSLRNWL